MIQPAFYRAGQTIQDGSHFVSGEVAQVMEDKDLPVMRRQNFQRLMQGFGTQGDVAVGCCRFAPGIDERRSDLFLTDFVAHKSSRLVMGDAIEPGPERFGYLERFQSAKCLEPDFLMKIKRIVSVWDQTPQVIKQRPFVTIEQTNECVSVTRLGFRNPEGFFESAKLLLGRTCWARIHRFFMVSRSRATVQTF